MVETLRGGTAAMKWLERNGGKGIGESGVEAEWGSKIGEL